MAMHQVPDPHWSGWGPREVRHPENTPGWFLPYEAFLEKYSPAFRFLRVKRLRIEFALSCPGSESTRLPGNSEGTTRRPWLVCLHARVRWSMFREFIDPPPIETMRKWRRDGVRILFRQVAFAEFWQRDPILWPSRWRSCPGLWWNRAEERADVLMLVWEEWVQRYPSRRPDSKKPPLHP